MNAVILGLNSVARPIEYLKKPQPQHQDGKDGNHTERQFFEPSVENLY